MSKLGEPRQVNVKLYKLNISYSSCSIHLFQGFFYLLFLRKHILAYQCETERKNQQGEGRISFFHTM